ncbi:MAG: DUF499 domain-containing protein [Ignavibacteriales bacterium]|nr:DUF499 domain-containing protein [Ignavibacteriales bacterium]
MKLRPWYDVVKPRSDLREGKPLDAAEFAVHLDQVRDGRAPDVYQNPKEFFERTYLTQNLAGLAAEVVRRLNGERTETSAVFNLATQFGGGKTHALTLLYHLAAHGPASKEWPGVKQIIEKSGMPDIPKAATAVFVGTEFDSLTGRGGKDGNPLRKTPWGEIAFQLGGADALAVLAEHEKQLIAPAGDVIRLFLPKDKPCLILFDEVLNYVGRNRKSGLSAQLFTFLQNLSEEARGRSNLVLVVSIPKSEIEMTPEDQSDHERFKNVLNRLGKAVFMSAETETSEIIRRRLFEWHGLPEDANKTIAAYVEWISAHKKQLPDDFAKGKIRDEFAATYPFHPTVISVFERKWQALPRFQRTRGVLRLLALWVSKAYSEGYKGAHKDPLISLGTAPLDDPIFRAAIFEQLGESRLEVSVTTDIVGKSSSHASRLDEEAVQTIKDARLHRKASTAIFFESNGGQARTEATIPEIRLDVADPDLDIGNVETILEALTETSYFLNVDKNRYRYGLTPNLNKLLADRRASIQSSRIDERVKAEVQKAFPPAAGVERIFFPEKSGQISDRPIITFVILSADQSRTEPGTVPMIEAMTRDCGTSARTFKSALIWCVPESGDLMKEDARKTLAWEDIQVEAQELQLDESQTRQLSENLKKALRDLRESAWRTYKNLYLLGKDNQIRFIDLGMINSSASESIMSYVINRLRQDDEIVKDVSPTFLVKNWPGAFKEWSTKSARDAFFASPQFPRLLNSEAIRESITKGVENGYLAYVGKDPSGKYDPFFFKKAMSSTEVDVSDQMFIITGTEAEKHLEPPKLVSIQILPAYAHLKPGVQQAFSAKGIDQHGNDLKLTQSSWKATGGRFIENEVFEAGEKEGNYLITVSCGVVSATAQVVVSKEETPPPQPPPATGVATLRWSGEVPPQKWMNFYTKILAKFVSGKGLKLSVNFDVAPEGGVSTQQVEETKVALREIGLDDKLTVE